MPHAHEEREDLLGEAKALVERVELLMEASPPVVVGFRRDGSVSFFFGAEPVYQFNTRDEFRRGFYEGKLIKAENEKLVALERRPQSDATFLVRHEWTSDATTTWLEDAAGRLADLRTRLDTGAFKISRQVPADTDIVGRVRGWLESLQTPIRVARRPNVGRP